MPQGQWICRPGVWKLYYHMNFIIGGPWTIEQSLLWRDCKEMIIGLQWWWTYHAYTGGFSDDELAVDVCCGTNLLYI